MKYVFLFVIGLSLSIGAFSQQYKQSIGIRGGISSGFEYRVFDSDKSSYKALFSTRNNGLQLVGLKEFHEFGLFDFSDELSLIYGFGLHAGYERWEVYDSHNNYYRWEDRTAPVVGLDGLAAIEYNFTEAPLSLGIEAKPFFDLLGRHFFRIQPFDFAFTVKYNF